MPIPVQSHSTKKTVPPTQAGSKDGGEPQKTSAARGISTLPVLRKGATSGYPRGVGGHGRTQSASQIQQSTVKGPKPDAIQAPKPRPAVASGLGSSKHDPVTSSRSGSSRTYSTFNITAHNAQAGSKPLLTNNPQHFNPKNQRSEVQSAAREVGTNLIPNRDTTGFQSSRLHDELMQLILVHARSRHTLNQYGTSANAKLESRAQGLRREEAEIILLEQKQQQDANVIGLVNWLGRWSPDMAIEQVHKLCLCIQQLSGLADEAGEFSRILRQFEEWHVCAESAFLEMSREAELKCVGFNPIESLDQAWHDVVEDLKTQLSLCTHTLRELGNSEGALDAVICGHRDLARTMLEQLELCSQLYCSFMEYQQEHVTRSLASVVSEAEWNERKAETPQRIPLWQRSRVD